MNDTHRIDWNDLGAEAREPAIASVVRRARVSREEAEEMVSEAVLRIMRTRPLVQNPTALLVRAALNLHSTERVRAKRRPTLFAMASDIDGAEPEGREADPAEAIADDEEAAARSAELRAALDRLSASDRFLLTAFYSDGRSRDEIEASLGIAAGQANVRLCRARQRLRRIFDATEEGSGESG